MIETGLYEPILRGEGVRIDNGWNLELASDYKNLRFHITFLEAMGRRLRRNYSFAGLLTLALLILKGQRAVGRVE